MAASVARRLLRRIRRSFGPAPIDSGAALRTFVEERAALIAQKCAVDYCRGKTGLASYALFTEKPFLKAFEVCRWETFLATLGDLLILVESTLRAHVPPERQAKLREALLGVHAATLAALPAPEHRTDGWAEANASFALRFETACRQSPRPPVEIASHSAARLFETLPIHISMRELDEEVVHGAVRFRMIAVHQELERRMVAAKLIAELAG